MHNTTPTRTVKLNTTIKANQKHKINKS